jgi:hypothetical protein
VQGDSIEVVEQVNAFWCAGKKAGGSGSPPQASESLVGYFPIVFVQQSSTYLSSLSSLFSSIYRSLVLCGTI